MNNQATKTFYLNELKGVAKSNAMESYRRKIQNSGEQTNLIKVGILEQMAAHEIGNLDPVFNFSYSSNDGFSFASGYLDKKVIQNLLNDESYFEKINSIKINNPKKSFSKDDLEVAVNSNEYPHPEWATELENKIKHFLIDHIDRLKNHGLFIFEHTNSDLFIITEIKKNGIKFDENGKISQ